MIIRFEEYINEGIRDKMTPKSKDDILKDLLRNSSFNKYYKICVLILDHQDDVFITAFCDKFDIDIENEQFKEIKKRVKDIDNLYDKIKNSIEVGKEEESWKSSDSSSIEYGFHLLDSNNKHFFAGMQLSFEIVDEEKFCNFWYYLDNGITYMDVEPDTIEGLESMIKRYIK